LSRAGRRSHAVFVVFFDRAQVDVCGVRVQVTELTEAVTVTEALKGADYSAD